MQLRHNTLQLLVPRSKFLLCACLMAASTCRAQELGAPNSQTRPLQYSTTWIGNTFGGGPKWVQNFAEEMQVLPDGTVIVGSFWDEAGREVGLYKDGQPIAKLEDTHMRGGKAIAATPKYIFYAQTSMREDQPEVKAGESRSDKPINLFGIGRWTLDGKVAPFAGGGTRFKNMAVLREAPDNQELIPRGLATDGTTLYVADTLQNRIRTFDVETMKPGRDWPAQNPERLALDKGGSLWVLQSGGKKIGCFSPQGKPQNKAVPLPADSVATSISFAPDGRLVVTDNGPRQQVLFFDVSRSPARLQGAFGERGGVFGGAQPGRISPHRLIGPTGAGFDARGNFYVAGNTSGGGSVLRAYSNTSARALKWELLGLEFVDVADAVPGSDGRDVFSATERYSFDPDGKAGSDWKWAAHTLNPLRFPDDLRLHHGVLQCATSIRKIGGETFLCQRGMWQGILGFYRVEGGQTVPSTVLSSGPVKAEKGDWKAAGQPESGRFFWRDGNGDGRFGAGEYTPTTGPDGEYWASNVDERGDIWQAGQESGIWKWKFTGLDAHKNPQYDPAPQHWPMPAPFNNLLRTEYIAQSDTMFLTGNTPERPMSGGEWGTMGTIVARYDNWSTAPKLRYQVAMPYEAGKTFMVSFHTAGYLFFAVDCRTAAVYVHDNRDGRLLGVLKPGPEVSGESGWVDFRDGVRAVRRANGDYLVFVEEDAKAKAIVYRLSDPLKP